MAYLSYWKRRWGTCFDRHYWILFFSSCCSLFDGKGYILKAWKAALLNGEKKAPPTIEKEKLLEYIDRTLALIGQDKE